jgi:hypothetical protein
MSRKLTRNSVLAVGVAALVFASAALAQMPANPFENPKFQKFWNPVVGTGEVLETTDNDKHATKHLFEFQVISKESVGGNDGFWLEMSMDDTQFGTLYGKSLLVPAQARFVKMIVKMADMDPMEMPVGTTPGSRLQADTSHMQKIGTESVTVPAGTFTCDHWKDDRGSEAWTSSQVSPISLVKAVDKSDTTVLVKMLSKTQEHITGTVHPFDPQLLMQLSSKARH